MNYYLVIPGLHISEGKTSSYWMMDNGDTWINAANSHWKEKHELDRVLEVVKEEHHTLLNWTKTPFYGHDYISGWLSREGRFYGCPSNYHDVLAYCVLGMKVPELEKLGWVRVYSHNWFTCDHRLSAEQRNWLSESGHKVLDSH